MTEFIEWRDEVWRRRLWVWYLQKRKPQTPRSPKPDLGSVRYLTGGKHILRRSDDDVKRKRRLATKAKIEARRAQRCKPRKARTIKGEKVEGKFQREKWPTMAYQTIAKIEQMTEGARRAQRRFVKKKGALIIRTIRRGMQAVSV